MKIAAVSKIVLGTVWGVICTASADDLLGMNDFNNGVSLPWNISESAETNSSFAVTPEGEYKISIASGADNRWDVQTRHRGFVLEQGHTYTVKFKVRSDKATKVYVKIGQQDAPFSEYWNNNWAPFSLTANQTLSVEQTFTMNSTTDASVEFAFHLGGDLTGSVPLNVWFDDIYLSDPQYHKEITDTGTALHAIRINQVGYLPQTNKHAIWVSQNQIAQKWYLLNAQNEQVATGMTIPKGADAASGESLQWIDFSMFNVQGSGYHFVVGKDTSGLFAVNSNVYATLRNDAIAYFYHNRSGIPIVMPYAGREDLTRLAGHSPDMAATWPGTGQPSYSLDVSKGWYDAGDHGKYVVNGGISVWTMLNSYEFTQRLGTQATATMNDGTLAIPEKSNGIPDVLDEARWEMEFLLSMIVPAGNPLAGMAHHKIHDEKWTALGLAPADDKMTRYLSPASTAATLNVAAAAAQAARIFKQYDKTFADKCLAAAKNAWDAAVLHPSLFAPAGAVGGGPYDDSNVSDEFYWAAAELYATTHEAKYLTYLQSSSHYLEVPTTMESDGGAAAPFTWGNTQGLGTVALALDDSFPAVETARLHIKNSADQFITTMENEGYRVPLKGTDAYPWGSNSFVLNSSVVMALANYFTKEEKYSDACAESFDYILGRNAMDQSYISGYGYRPLKNPHHRFWAWQANAAFPKAPAGAVSGGPNSSLQDPWVKAAGLEGSPFAKCFLDHIEAWSVNEITINWNAPLFWVSSYLDNIQRIETGTTANLSDREIRRSPVAIQIRKQGAQVFVSNLTGTQARMKILDLRGRVLGSYSAAINNGIGSIDLNKSLSGHGHFLVMVENHGNQIVQKFVW